MSQTRSEEFEEAFGVELTSCEINNNTYGIDINAPFDDYAVYFRADFSKKVIVPAHICEFKPTKKYGAIPSGCCADDTSKPNWSIGEYTIDEAQVILKGNNNEVFDFYANIAGFGEYENYAVAKVWKKDLNEFMPYALGKEIFGYFGFFNSLSTAIEKMNIIKDAKIAKLKKELENMSWFSLS